MSASVALRDAQDAAPPRPRIMVVGGTDGGSRAIERAGFGPFSHMASILADGTILDARDNEIGGVPAGVQLRPTGYLDTYPAAATFEAPTPCHYASWEAALRSQLLKPYDMRGIEDFAEGTFTGRYLDPNYAAGASKAWFCDELAAWAAILSGDIPEPPPWVPLFTQTPVAALNFFIGAGWRLVDSKGL